jgi:hypothetical protein
LLLKNQIEWKRMGETINTYKDSKYSRRTKFLNKVGWIFEHLHKKNLFIIKNVECLYTAQTSLKFHLATPINHFLNFPIIFWLQKKKKNNVKKCCIQFSKYRHWKYGHFQKKIK